MRPHKSDMCCANEAQGTPKVQNRVKSKHRPRHRPNIQMMSFNFHEVITMLHKGLVL